MDAECERGIGLPCVEQITVRGLVDVAVDQPSEMILIEHGTGLTDRCDSNATGGIDRWRT